MADGNPLLEQVKKDVAEGYSKESIIAELKRVGKYDNELRSFLEGGEETEPLKKKSNSQSTTGTDTTGSQLGIGTSGSPVSVSTQDVPAWAQMPEQTQAGVPSKEENFVVNQRKKSALGGEMGRVQQEQELAVNEWLEYRNGSRTLEKPIAPIPLGNQPEDFISPMQSKFEREQRLYQLNLEIFNAKSADEVRDIILRRNATEINNSYRDAYGKSAVPFGGLGDEKDNLINIVEDENGNLVSSINEKNMSTAIIDIEKAQLNEQKMVEEEQAKLQGMSGIGHVAYDFTTGLMDMTNSFQSLWDREQAQQDIYENTMRTQASYLDYGLSQEEISKGIIENVLDGNYGAASKVFAVQSAQTAPQLLAQAGIAYATAGMGLSTTAATWASSGFMGVSTFGSTWANTYGFVSDDKAFTMALGDAVVETVSEKLFAGDVKALAGLDDLKGMSVRDIRKTLFGKGLISTEFKNLAKEKGIDIVKGGGEEAVEEMFAGIGSQYVHAAVNNEEFNIFEAIDGAIVGFGMGSGSKGVASSRSLLVGGVSALGYGGLRKEMITYKNARQALAKELSQTTDSAKKEALEAKIKGLDKTIASIGVDMQGVYNQYSDEDANTTISLNQKLSKKIADIRSEQNPEVRKALEMEAKQMFAEIQKIEQKYEPVRAKIKEDKKNVASRMANQMEESVEVDENFQTDGISIFEGIKNVASSLKGKAKVFVHKSADAAAKAANVSQDDVLGSAGFYVQEDGTIHIVPTVAQNNTAYHEGTHKIARSVDPEYISRFVQASLLGMDEQTRAKYEEIQQKYKDNKQLANEEVFSEMVADIADGTISIENQGTSVARAGMKVISDVLAKVGLNKTKVATLKDFSDFVNQVSEDFKTGREVADAPEGVRTAEKKLGEKEALFSKLMDSEPNSVGAAVQINPEGTTKIEPRKESPYKGMNNMSEDVEMVSMEEFNNRVDGQLYAVTSDATKVGTDKDGDSIDGGFGYTHFVQNLLGKVGFASLDMTIAKQTIKTIMNRFEAGSKVGIMIMIQNPSATIGNYYGGKYLHRGLVKLQKELGQEGYNSIYESIVNLIETNKTIAADLKKNKTKNQLLELLKDPSKLNDKEFAKEWIKDTSFDVRRELLNRMFIMSETTRTNKNTPEYKMKLKEYGFNIVDFLMEYGDIGLIGENNLRDNKGGFLVGGFEFIVPTKEELDSVVSDVEGRGFTHPQFNGKLPSNGKHYIFDGLYPIQENLVEFAQPETEIPKEFFNERDARVRKLAEEKGEFIFEEDYRNENSKKYVAPEERTYTHMTTPSKIRFKAENKDITREKVPNLFTSVARGVGFTLSAPVPVGTKFTRALLHQAGIFKEIADMLASGKKKSEVIADLRERGISKVEAELIYQKALGYKQGMTQGRQAGRKERSAAYAEQKKAEREKESQKVKDFRKRVKKIYEIEGKLNDAFIREFVKLAKELGGAKIKANQLERIIRAVNAAGKVRGRKAYEPSIRYAAFNKLVDKVALIIDGAIEAQALIEYGEQLKRVASLQKELKNKLKSVTATSKNPIVSYSEAVLDLTSIDPTVISMESLDVLESALKDLKNTARNVSVRKGELAAPYIFIEELGENIDLRRAKIYFSEIFDTLHHEATEAQEKQIVEQAIEAAFQNGTDWVTEYNNILQERLKKEMRGAEKRMNDIADEMGLDINDIQDLEGILAMMSEEKKEKLEQEKQAIIDGAIVPTFFNFIREYLNNTHFAEIFGVPESMSEEAMERVIRNRLNNLSGFELKRLEFAMFDYAVNGKAYGITQLAAVIAAKNDGNAKLRKANMVANKPKSSTANYIYNMFENTPTFFRRAFKKYSLSKVAEFTDALGFARLRSNVSIADTMADAFGKRVVEKAKELGIDTLGDQVRMQVYSILTQVPEGTSKTMWLRALMSNIDLALESDNRFTDAQKNEIREAISVFRTDNRTRNYDVIVEELEADNKMMEMVNFLRSEFAQQEGGLRDYAEGYLGMKFQSVDNYLPFRFRSTGAMTRSLQELTEGNQTLAQAFRAYNVGQANKQAQSTYERNERAFESNNRYVDLNFLSTLTNAYRENQVKIMTAPDVAYISAMTSESNQDFVNSVPDSQIRGAMRRKIYNYLTDGGAMVSRTDSVIGAKMAKAVGRIKDVTVLYYFGSIVNQLFKQSSAIMNAMIEGSMNPMELMTTAAQVLTNRLDKGKMALAEKYDIGQRDVVTEIISATSKSDAITAGGGFFKKNMDRSTFFLRRTDKAAAFASWFSYYESYMRKNEGLKGNIDWDALAENPNDKAAEYATSMVTKDQNINTSRDKSEFNSLNQSQVGGILQMLVMPFANFLLNKKLNMALDYQKAFSDNADNRKEGLKSLGGSVLEIAAFHSISQFVIIPMLQAVASGLFGDDEEEESLFDKEFRMRNFLKGMSTDMNPLIMPIGAMESFYAKGINLLAYVSSGDVDKYSFEDKSFWDGFAAWSKANGLPEFGGVGRDDLGALGFLRQFGVFGDVAVELTTSLVNIASLSEKNPYMTTIYGSTKYLTPEDAKDARMLEFLKASLIISGGVTGLFAKESVQIAKNAEKPLTNRGLSSEKENIGRILTIDKDLGKELVKDMAYKMKEDNPLSVEPMLKQVLSQSTIKAKVDEKTSDKYVNTIRQIEKMSYDDVRYAALYAKKVMKDMTPQESKEFESELLKFFLIKQGQGSIIRIKNLLNQEENE